MAERACPVCAGPRESVFVEERRDPIGGVLYRLHRCGTCGLVFSEPREAVGPDWYEKSAPLRATERRAEAAGDWRFRRFLDAGLAPGKVLDIGCGDGSFLALAGARGWTGAGVDYEERMVALGRARRLDLEARDFGDYLKSRASKEFDAVVLFDVLEHVPEPRDLLARIKPVLKRGGRLAVTLPNDARPALFPRPEYDYPPHHFTRWTGACLRRLLEREGFAVETLEALGPTARWFSEMIFYSWIMPPVLALARRVLFSGKKEGTISELYAARAGGAAALADKSRRQSLADLFKYGCRLVTCPLGAVFALFYRLARRDAGEHLFCLARYEA